MPKTSTSCQFRGRSGGFPPLACQHRLVPTERRSKLGLSRSLLGDGWVYPIYGLRHPATETTTGWFIRTGDLSGVDDFFEPVHQDHFATRWPDLAHLLELPPGSRFLAAPGHEDVWNDPSLLDV